MKVEDIMTKEALVAEVPGSRYDVLRLFAKFNISGVPVVNKTKELVGIVTRKDIFRNKEEDQLALIMTKNPISVTPEDNIKKASKILYDKKIHRLPVVTNKKVVGILTVKDLLKILARSKKDSHVPVKSCVPIYISTPLPLAMEIINITGEYALPVVDKDCKLVGIVTDRDLSKAAKVDVRSAIATLGMGIDDDPWTWEGLRNIMKFYYDISKVHLPSVSVAKVMATEVVTATTLTRVSEAARNMVEHDLNQLPVITRGRKLLGMVYDLDLLKYLK
ncbi:MAG: CBS domain-containing protein [Candidatus Thermoplasmatota archaeon]|nr:CBS domain-containing protein [Candidatus Thermoplasmatota archaeon]